MPTGSDRLSLFVELDRWRRLAGAQVVPEPLRCVQCGICTFNCPINIDVRSYARRGIPINDSHCLTCGECVMRCPRDVLRFELATPSVEIHRGEH